MKKIIVAAIALSFSAAVVAQGDAKKEANKGKRVEEKQRVEDKSKPLKIENQGKRKDEGQRTEKK